MEEFSEFATELPTALGEGLGMLADADAPPSSVNATEAVRQGRARVRRRRTAVLGAVAAIVVTAGALGSLRPSGGGHAEPGLPAASLSSGPAAPSRLPSPTVSGSPWTGPSGGPIPMPSRTVVSYPGKDPLNGTLRFGWLPDGLTAVSYTMGFDGIRLRVSPPWKDMKGLQGGPYLDVKLFPAGTAPTAAHIPPQMHPKFVPAPPVNGQEAHWVTVDDQAMAQQLDELQWKTPSGQWADLDAAYLKPEDRQRVPLQVAAGVDTQPHDTPLPVQLTGLPAEYTVLNGEFDRSTADPKGWSLRLGFQVAADKYFGIRVQPDGPSASASPSGPNGAPPYQRPQACKTEQGLRICVETMQDPNAVFAAIGGMEAMLPKITGLGLDEANWTTDVIN